MPNLSCVFQKLNRSVERKNASVKRLQMKCLRLIAQKTEQLLAYYEHTLDQSKTSPLKILSKGRATVDEREYVKIVKYYDALFSEKVQFNLAFAIRTILKRQRACRKFRRAL